MTSTALILGGTEFLGPALVEACRTESFQVTLFNRVFNAVGPRRVMSMKALLEEIRATIGCECSFEWLSEELLMENEVGVYTELPLWIPATIRRTYDCTRATERGLTFRPLAETIEATLAWHENERPPGPRFHGGGMAEAREMELPGKWDDA